MSIRVYIVDKPFAVPIEHTEKEETKTGHYRVCTLSWPRLRRRSTRKPAFDFVKDDVLHVVEESPYFTHQRGTECASIIQPERGTFERLCVSGKLHERA